MTKVFEKLLMDFEAKARSLYSEDYVPLHRPIFDTSEENCPTGTILEAGTAKLKVSGIFNEGCVKWKVRYGADAKNWITLEENKPLRLRGLLCAVISAGQIRNGDLLKKIS